MYYMQTELIQQAFSKPLVLQNQITFALHEAKPTQSLSWKLTVPSTI